MAAPSGKCPRHRDAPRPLLRRYAPIWTASGPSGRPFLTATVAVRPRPESVRSRPAHGTERNSTPSARTTSPSATFVSGQGPPNAAHRSGAGELTLSRCLGHELTPGEARASRPATQRQRAPVSRFSARSSELSRAAQALACPQSPAMTSATTWPPKQPLAGCARAPTCRAARSHVHAYAGRSRCRRPQVERPAQREPQR